MQMRGARKGGGVADQMKRGQRACQSANHRSALVALWPSLTFWPWPWPKCQRSPTRVRADHCKTLTRDVSPWQRCTHYRRKDGGVLHSVCWNLAHTRTHTYTRINIHLLLGVKPTPPLVWSEQIHTWAKCKNVLNAGFIYQSTIILHTCTLATLVQNATMEVHSVTMFHFERSLMKWGLWGAGVSVPHVAHMSAMSSLWNTNWILTSMCIYKR